ncbi:MAG: hypothetical protein GX639_07060 [Fibrobacter sp.]|nr:hypothetical protein [Fibrobacter sp.]
MQLVRVYYDGEYRSSQFLNYSSREDLHMELERKIVTGILICGVVTVFIVVSALVVLTGRNPFFVKKKLAVGALLLSLSTIMSGCKCSPGGIVSCYARKV